MSFYLLLLFSFSSTSARWRLILPASKVGQVYLGTASVGPHVMLPFSIFWLLVIWSLSSLHLHLFTTLFTSHFSHWSQTTHHTCLLCHLPFAICHWQFLHLPHPPHTLKEQLLFTWFFADCSLYCKATTWLSISPNFTSLMLDEWESTTICKQKHLPTSQLLVLIIILYSLFKSAFPGSVSASTVELQ